MLERQSFKGVQLLSYSVAETENILKNSIVEEWNISHVCIFG